MSWFSDIIWPTICVGSTGEVGSWHCSSVHNSCKKVVSMLPEPLALLELLELVVELLEVLGIWVVTAVVDILFS